MSLKFQKNKEDFVCQNCGFKVKGTGYTNHCPNCLWSKHVDIYPGDRKNNCGGLMKPIKIEVKNDNYLKDYEDISKKSECFDNLERVIEKNANVFGATCYCLTFINCYIIISMINN